jgi:heptaprenyl diphosphate synthase
MHVARYLNIYLESRRRGTTGCPNEAKVLDLATSAESSAAQLLSTLGEQVSFIAGRTSDALEDRISPLLDLFDSPMDRKALSILLCGGKRIRTRVTTLVALAIGKPDMDALVRLCTAIELLHTASLVHDDIIDESATRRGSVTLHLQTSPATAILAGDLLVGIAFAEVASLGERAVSILSRAFTSLCIGQLSEAALSWEPGAQAAIEHYARHKTGALFAAAFELGALTNGLSIAIGRGFREAGETLGLAFQLCDDLLDVQGDVEELDKDHGADIRNGIPTLPIWHAFQQIRLLPEYVVGGSAGSTKLLSDEAMSLRSRDFTVHRITELLDELRLAMPPVENQELIEEAIGAVLSGITDHSFVSPNIGTL